jgi:uncharacterized repeat protein (TIGR01451 family)
MGHDFGTIPNVWRNDQNNDHFFGTYALTKQPSRGPYPVGIGSLEDLLEGSEEVEGGLDPAQADWPNGFDGAFFGHVEYEITEVSTNEAGDPLVEWGVGCESISSDGSVCTDVADVYGEVSGVSLSPTNDVDLEELPISVTVTATYYFTVTYGDEVYEFALKDYTFTKEWIGGFLEVDKHVENHVLTWHGEDVTLGAEDVVTDEDYRSTVHVTVSNDSDSTIYNVTVRDAVPAELGVVTDSITPSTGTYDPINHVVTWSYTQEESLENLDVGDSEEFTFDVYARHKPGYCWEGEGDGSFNVQPRNPSVDGDGQCNPYADPYRVTNGQQNQSVTAAGFFEDSTAGEQLVFSYSPVADESDIWVVRPLFEITKDRVSQSVMPEGASADYRIEVRQLDRVAMDAAAGHSWTDYSDLDARYPWEFGGALADAPADWHVGDASIERNNPYAHDVTVVDAFDHGLDFTNATNFSNVSGGVLQTSAPTVSKEVNWSPIDNLPVGVTAQASVTLTGNLLSDNNEAGNANSTDADPEDEHALNGSYEDGNGATVLNSNGFDRWAWENCAFLGADQLNQSAQREFVEGSFTTWYVDNTWFPWTAFESPDFVENLTNDNSELAADRTFIGVDGTYGEGQIYDCANVAVIPPPPEPFMTLTTNGEFQGEVDGGEEGHDVPQIIQGNLEDGYTVDETFVYKMTAQNAGGLQADGVEISAEFLFGVVQFDGQASLYLGQSGSWTQQETISVSGSNAAFSPVSVPAGEFVRVVFEARANQVGVGNMVTQLTYNNAPSFQNLPLEVLEETSVQGD